VAALESSREFVQWAEALGAGPALERQRAILEQIKVISILEDHK
jgi:hypothetical protein